MAASLPWKGRSSPDWRPRRPRHRGGGRAGWLRALELVAHSSDERLRASVPDALLRGRFLATRMRGEDQPQDLYVALLSTPRRSAVVAGIAMVFGELAPALAMLPEALAPAQQRALDALMTLIDLAHPAEFKRRTESVLTLVLDPAVPEAVRDPVVRAAVGYTRGQDDVRH